MRRVFAAACVAVLLVALCGCSEYEDIVALAESGAPVSDVSDASVQSYYDAMNEEADGVLSELLASAEAAVDTDTVNEYVWACDGHYNISSAFGSRMLRHERGLHGGLDIADGSIYGADVTATKRGTVVVASYSDTDYGNYVMIYHGSNVFSLYGHLSSICVYVGQTVEQKQKIGEVGNSGNSTGAHLHFEMRVDGKKTNPLYYVRLPKG